MQPLHHAAVFLCALGRLVVAMQQSVRNFCSNRVNSGAASCIQPVIFDMAQHIFCWLRHIGSHVPHSIL